MDQSSPSPCLSESSAGSNGLIAKKPWFPYQEGGVLVLRTESVSPFRRPELKVRVVKLYQPSTLSCVMEVDVIGDGPEEGRAVLKLFDRRFATQLRRDHFIDPWSPEHEAAFTTFVRNGGAEKFLKSLRDDDDFEEPEDGWDIAENETYLYDMCLDMYNTETSTYMRLQDHQGTRIPRLLAQVSFTFGATDIDIEAVGDLFDVKGVLLEFIPGFTLAQLETKAPPESWQSIVDQAIKIVHILSDNNILNEDVRTSNVLVTKDEKCECGYRVMMIDFAQCRFRGKDESDLEWGRAKWSQDEEGAIGMVMQSRLKKVSFDLRYSNSMRFWEWAEKEEDGETG